MINKLINLFKQSNIKVAILMSGVGSNAEVILKQRYRYNNLDFVSIVTENPASNAKTLASKFKLDYYCLPVINKANFDREHYFNDIANYLFNLKIDLIIYAGFSMIVTKKFLEQFPGINIHPADLTILHNNGEPKYTGIKAIELALANNEKYLASTVHVVDVPVDHGKPIAVSKHLLLTEDLKKLSIEDLHQQIKIHCEHNTYPDIISRLSKGIIKMEDKPLLLELEDNNANYFIEDIKKHSQTLYPLEKMFVAQKCCQQFGFDFDDVDLVFGKVIEEFGELKEVYHQRHNKKEELELEIGDCFFALVNLCRHLNLDINDLLHRNFNKYIDRCNFVEHQLKEQNKSWQDISLEEIYQLWKLAKMHCEH